MKAISAVVLCGFALILVIGALNKDSKNTRNREPSVQNKKEQTSSAVAESNEPSAKPVTLPPGQAGRDELARMMNETGQGVVRAHAKGETIIFESDAFDESLNRRHWAQMNGLTFKLCGVGFTQMQMRGPTKLETRSLSCK